MNYDIYTTNSNNMQNLASYNMFADPNYFFQNTSEYHETRNRFVYINQNFINTKTGINTKVLINPNFKQTVHINPNFRKLAKPSIHVNPHVLKLNDTAVIKSNIGESSKDRLNLEDVTKTKPIISTKTNLIRSKNEDKSQCDLIKQERRKSVHTKYKIIHSNKNLKEKNILSKNYLTSKYKIDKSILKTKVLGRDVAKSRYCLSNISINKKVRPRKHMKDSNSKYISINGTLYKKTPNILRKADLVNITSGKTKINRNKVLLIRGHLYKLDHHQKRLKMLPLTQHSAQKYAFKKDGTNVNIRQINMSLKLNKGKRRLIMSNVNNPTNGISINQMKKCNLSCPIYRKFGKCKANEIGKCIKVHNPNQIMLCTKFLQGACFNSNCLLSHKVSAEKMPTCKYFLEGLCVKENCVYLHVKISPKADICKDFLQGYCKRANECDKRHQFLCPDYEKNGSCTRRRCQYPHGNSVRKTKYINKVAKRIVRKKIAVKPLKTKAINKDDNEQHDKNIRYYAENSEEVDQKDLGILTENILYNENGNVICSNLKLLKRAQLGVLPSYIPLGTGDAPSH